MTNSEERSGGGKGRRGRAPPLAALCRGAAFEGRKFRILAFTLQCVNRKFRPIFIFNLFIALRMGVAGWRDGTTDLCPLDWEFVTSVFKISKKFANFTILKNRINSFYKLQCVRIRATLATVENISLQSITLRQPLNGKSGQLRTPILTLGKTWSCEWFVDFVKGCSWSCWPVDKLTNHELLTYRIFNLKKLGVLRLRRRVCRNLSAINVMNF